MFAAILGLILAAIFIIVAVSVGQLLPLIFFIIFFVFILWYTRPRHRPQVDHTDHTDRDTADH